MWSIWTLSQFTNQTATAFLRPVQRSSASVGMALLYSTPSSGAWAAGGGVGTGVLVSPCVRAVISTKQILLLLLPGALLKLSLPSRTSTAAVPSIQCCVAVGTP